MKQRSLSAVIYVLTTVIGVLAFLYPFWLPAFSRMANTGMAHAGDAPLMLSLLVGLCFVVLLLEVQSQAMNAKTVALLGILVSINAVLRFAEVAIPGPGGFSPIFLLIVLTGYVYGARFGFLMGVLTLLVSSLITGTVGPWLPYQMFAAGWSGMAAPLCRPVVRLLRAEQSWGEVTVLAVYSGLWGLIYGARCNTVSDTAYDGRRNHDPSGRPTCTPGSARGALRDHRSCDGGRRVRRRGWARSATAGAVGTPTISVGDASVHEGDTGGSSPSASRSPCRSRPRRPYASNTP